MSEYYKKSSRSAWLILVLGLILWTLFIINPQWFVVPDFKAQASPSCPYGVLDC